MPNGLFYRNSLDRSISNLWGVWLVLGLLLITEIPALNENSVDPDLTPCSVASDLILHCFQMSHLWGARLKWVTTYL